MTEKWWFTLGQAHVHRIGSYTADCDCLIEIEGNYKEARHRMIELCGLKWSHQYDPQDVDLSLYPRGVWKDKR